MPFKSESQKKKLAELVAKGKLPKSVYDAFNEGSTKEKLPERIHPKKVKKVKVIK
jgi:hypothetical protein